MFALARLPRYFIAIFLFILLSLTDLWGQVTCVRDTIEMPTYLLGPQEKNPVFKDFNLPGLKFFRSSRSVYPYTLMDKYTRQREMRSYEVIILENEYIQVHVMPDLRGRIQGATDKRNGWDFLYYNHVIKPAEIAVRSAWISGGLEWNHPQGHGYTQFSRISHRITDEPDGGKTVWIAEIEPNRNMKWEVAITLRPGRLFLETRGRFISVLPYPVQFASSQNAAMHASDEMEMIFPEGSHVSGHGKARTYLWPRADETEVDHSWFKNSKRAVSVFVDGRGLIQDHWGCYSHDGDIDAGTVIVSDYRDAPGKKYFTWGSHPLGRLWDTLLSDEDGPYVELQLQAFWDNLGYGYAWLDPLEVKEYTAYWYPLMKTGGLVKANRDICLNIKKLSEKEAFLALQATRAIEHARISITAGKDVIFHKEIGLEPAFPFTGRISLPPNMNYESLVVNVSDHSGRSIMQYETKKKVPIDPLLAPENKSVDKMSVDELYRLGKSHYQDPFGPEAEEAYRAMLSRDPHESRALRSLGLVMLHRGLYEEAVKMLQESYRNDPLVRGKESIYYQALAEMKLDRLEEARVHLNIASRDKPMAAPALLALAEISIQEGKYGQALDELDLCMKRGGDHPRILELGLIAARKLDNPVGTDHYLNELDQCDPLSFIAVVESWLAAPEGDKPEFEQGIHYLFDRKDSCFVGSQLYLECARSYMDLGCHGDAARILELAIGYFGSRGMNYPMLYYYLGYAYQKLGDADLALQVWHKANEVEAMYDFPYRKESIEVLRSALEATVNQDRTLLYLGNLYYYLHRHQEAMDAWEQAAIINPENAMAFRNLALGVFYLEQDTLASISYFEKAIEAGGEDLRYFYEIDHLYAAAGMTGKRLALLENNAALVRKHDDLVIRWTDLYLRLEQYGKAADLMSSVWFPATEGSIGRYVRHARYSEAYRGLGWQQIRDGDPDRALESFRRALEFPANLNESQPEVQVLTRHYFLMGKAYEAMDRSVEAKKQWKEAARVPANEGTLGMYYKAMALEELGRVGEARAICNQLIEYCESLLSEDPGRRKAVCYYLMGLAYGNLGAAGEASKYLKMAFGAEPDVKVMAEMESVSL
jgi:tetratricopeptide (TPR) repeat protein